VNIKKIGQRKLNSGQRKTKGFMPGKCFPFFILRKTLSFLFNKTCTLLKYKSLNSFSLANNLPRSIGSISHSFLPGNFFFLKCLFIILYVFHLFLFFCCYNGMSCDIFAVFFSLFILLILLQPMLSCSV